MVSSSVLENIGFLKKLGDHFIQHFSSLWDEVEICNGHSDFKDVVDARYDCKIPFPTITRNEKFAQLETSNMIDLNRNNFCVIQSVNCDLLSTGGFYVYLARSCCLVYENKDDGN